MEDDHILANDIIVTSMFTVFEQELAKPLPQTDIGALAGASIRKEVVKQLREEIVEESLKRAKEYGELRLIDGHSLLDEV